MSDSEDEDEIPHYSPQLVRETYTTNNHTSESKGLVEPSR